MSVSRSLSSSEGVLACDTELAWYEAVGQGSARGRTVPSASVRRAAPCRNMPVDFALDLPMRITSIATIASVALYQGILLAGAIKGGAPASDSSYLAGLATFAVPFLLLMAAEAIGLPRPIATLCAGLGFLALALVLGLVLTDQALFVSAAVLFSYGFFSAGVLLCTGVGLGFRAVLGWMRQRGGRF